MRTLLIATCLVLSACADTGIVSKNGLISDADPPSGMDTDGTHPDQLDSGGPVAEGNDPSPWLDPNIKDPRPIVPPDTDPVPADTGGTPDTDSTPTTDTAGSPGSDTDSIPPTDTDTVPTSDTGTVPPTDTDTVPPTDTDTVPASDTDTVPASDTDTVPASDTDTVPASDTDTVPASDTDPTPVDTFDTADTGAWTDTDTVATPRAGTCARASRIPGYLDRFQTPLDGKVVFCHRTSTGNWTLIDTSTSACIHHAGHLLDLFPRSLCDN